MKILKLILLLPVLAVAAPLAKEPYPGKVKINHHPERGPEADVCPHCRYWARPDLRHTGDQPNYVDLGTRDLHSTYGDDIHYNHLEIHGDPTYTERPTIIHENPVHALPERKAPVIPIYGEPIHIHINRPTLTHGNPLHERKAIPNPDDSVSHHVLDDDYEYDARPDPEHNIWRRDNDTANNAAASNLTNNNYTNTTEPHQPNRMGVLQHIEEIIRHGFGPRDAQGTRVHTRSLENGQKLFDTQLPPNGDQGFGPQVDTKDIKHKKILKPFHGLVHGNGHWDGVARTNPYEDPHPDCEPGDYTYLNEKCVWKWRGPVGEAERKAGHQNDTRRALL